MKTKKEFENDFDLIDPKKMVTFVDAFRKGELWALSKNSDRSFLVENTGEENLISEINSDLWFFGTKKKKESDEYKIIIHLEGGFVHEVTNPD